MDFDFNSYKKSIISFKEDIYHILFLENDCICVGFTNGEINIYYPEDFTPKINIKYINDDQQESTHTAFLMEKEGNKLLTIYNCNILYIREIDYENYSYKDIKIIENFNYVYLRKSINENYFYGIDDNRIAYFKTNNEAMSVLRFNEYNIDFFYEIPSKATQEIVVKIQDSFEINFFDKNLFKKISTIFDIRLFRRSFDLSYRCPFIYYEKENLLGIFTCLIDFIDMKTHTKIYKYFNTSTTTSSIIYAHKLNNKKFFIVQYMRGCFSENSIIYLTDLEPKTISVSDFEENEITRLTCFGNERIIFSEFSPSMKYLILRSIDKSNQIILYSKN